MLHRLKNLSLQVLLIGALGFPLLQVSSCSSGGPDVPNDEALIETGNAMSDALMKNLGGQLKAALANGDPSAAVEFCAQVATPITDQTSGEFPEATVRRTSLRYRNLANSPDEIDLRILKNWESILEKGEGLPAYEITVVDENTSRFYRPLHIQKLCLTCHGDATSFSSELASVLAERYPNDLATDYVEGDLRGAFCVEFTH